MINFCLYHAMLIYMHYMKEQARFSILYLKVPHLIPYPRLTGGCILYKISSRSNSRRHRRPRSMSARRRILNED